MKTASSRLAVLSLLAAFSGVAMLCPAQAAAQSFSAVIGISPTPRTNVEALSADGTKATGFQSAAGIYEESAFIWSSGVTTTSLRDEPNASISNVGFGISNDGSVIVGDGGGIAFRWSGPGTFQYLLPSTGYISSYAKGVSGDGSRTVGYVSTGPNGFDVQQAAMWDANGSVTPLGFVPGGFDSTATAISRDGTTIVGSGLALTVDSFVWRESTGLQVLQSLPDPNHGGTFARAVSGDGRHIAGSSADVPVVWHDGVLTQLFGPGGAPAYGYLTGISDDGSVAAGIIRNTAHIPIEVPGVWTAETQFISLQDYLISQGVPIPQGVTLVQVNAISADGRTFGGLTDQGYGFIATIPTPGGTTFLALVSLTLSQPRRRR